MIIQSARTKRRRKDSEDDSNETDTDVPEVDLYQLQVNTLRRYKRHYKIPTRPGLNKAQLADVSITVKYQNYNFDVVSTLNSYLLILALCSYQRNQPINKIFIKAIVVVVHNLENARSVLDSLDLFKKCMFCVR